MKGRFKIFLILIMSILVSLYVFFLRTDAPILQGKVILNVEYKDGLTLDIYEPISELHPSRPVVVYYHGGAWVSGSKITANNNRFNETFNSLRKQGYTVISPDYTLAEFQKSPFPHCIEDAIDVIGWIEHNASTYNFDLNNVGVLGESAGGHLALMVAYADEEKFTDEHDIAVSYVAAIYPPTDLRKLNNDMKEMRGRITESTSSLPTAMQDYFDINQYLFGFDSDQDTLRANEITKLYSPINYVDSNIPNTLIIHGNKDRVVPISQSTRMKKRIASVGLTLDMHILDGVDHAFMDATPEQKQQTQKWITDFILEQHN